MRTILFPTLKLRLREGKKLLFFVCPSCKKPIPGCMVDGERQPISFGYEECPHCKSVHCVTPQTAETYNAWWFPDQFSLERN
jgi:hypothetical protein